MQVEFWLRHLHCILPWKIQTNIMDRAAHQGGKKGLVDLSNNHPDISSVVQIYPALVLSQSPVV